jgi:LysM repeat protein
MIIRALTILVLTAVIFGTAAYFAYDLYWKPQKLDRIDRETKALSPVQTQPTDFTLPAYEKAAKTAKGDDPAAGRTALTEFIHNYPESPNLPAARALLGELNSKQFFSSSDPYGKVQYTVASRDSLVRIAAKFKSSAELIFRVNNLDSINLKIGQQLVVPQSDVAVIIDRKKHTITIQNKGEFFREYKILSFKSPTALPGAKVVDKFATKDSKRVPFGDKNYEGSERVLMISGGGTIRAALEDGSNPAGIVVAPGDMDEIFLLVSRGTPVTMP